MPRAMRLRLTALIVALGMLAAQATTSPALAVGITVDSLADTADDDGTCTLREAIAAANSDLASPTPGECAPGQGADNIAFSVAGTITVGGQLPAIASDVTIDGAGVITVDGNSAGEVFRISSGNVTLDGLSITGGSTGGDGGGISSAGALTVANSTISGNAARSGGGIFNGGTLTVTNSTISGNTTAFGGAGIFNSFDGTLTVTNSTISGNTAPEFDAVGAGIENLGTLTVTNSTISGNTAGFGGGGIAAHGTETLVNTIVAGNAAPSGPEIDGAVETTTTSVVGVPAGMTLADILDPAGLSDNGSPTQTIALSLVAGNPAIDTGTSAACAAVPVDGVDQRGLPRPAACDIGAYEAQPPTIAAHADVTATATSASGAAVTFTPPAGTDEQGGAATVECLPASGSTFPVGSTTVTCTATDAVGHTASGTFAVVVSAAAAPPTPTPTSSASSLPDTAAGDGTSGSSVLPTVLAALSLLSLGLLARRAVRSRAPSRQGTARAGTGRRRG